MRSGTRHPTFCGMPYPAANPPLSLVDILARPVKKAIASEVVSLFNDRAQGEKPVRRRPDGLFGPGSVAWRVHGDVTSMMVGGIAGLLMQMLHPSVLAGVWDHSNFRTDMLGRLRRTARFIAMTTYGGPEEAQAAIDRVHRIHERVRGVLPDGTPYYANDPALLAWVHVTETTCFLDAWIRYGESRMSPADQDRYFAEMAEVAERLGVDPIPRSRAAARKIISSTRLSLRSDARTQEICHLLLHQRSSNSLTEPLHRLTMQAAIDLLPAWARRMHNLPDAGFGKPIVRAGTLGIARTLRWAFG